MALRFKPVDTAFYSLLTSSATQLVDGAALLAEMLGDGNDRKDIAASGCARPSTTRTRPPTRSSAG